MYYQPVEYFNRFNPIIVEEAIKSFIKPDGTYAVFGFNPIIVEEAIKRFNSLNQSGSGG